jgi:hypothetical protein
LFPVFSAMMPCISSNSRFTSSLLGLPFAWYLTNVALASSVLLFERS